MLRVTLRINPWQIHPSKEWEQAQRIVVAQLGIQQARLLAFGDMVGILDTTPNRDARLEDPDIRTTIEQALEAIIDRPAHTDRETQFEQYGLKPPKKFTRASQPSLDVARIESFRERLEILQKQRWEVKRGMSITISHWTIHDIEKFKTFLALITEKINFLVAFMGVEQKVHTAVKYDIKALGWHPVFDKMKASNDMSKLRLIQQACEVNYPEYSAAAEVALEYLNKEYRDNYQELREGAVTSTEIPGAAQYMIAQSRQLAAAYEKKNKPKSPGLLARIRPKSWRKNSKDLAVKPAEDDGKGRSMSYAPISSETPLTPPLTPERSKSLAVPFTSEEKAQLGIENERRSEDNIISRTETAQSDMGATAVPVTSMISRHDYWKSPW